MTLSVALQHRFPGFALDAAFEVPAGVTVLFGRSGSGKTTIVNAVAGLLRPDQGRITLDGAVLQDSAARLFVPPQRRRIGYVFQDQRLFPHMTVRQNLLYGRRFAKTPREADFGRIVDLLGIAALLDRRPAALSGGEKSRVGIGRAILSDPRLLVMDEPLAALDVARKAEILTYLERLRDETGLPILYVSHAMAEVARLATTLVVVEAGRVLAAGPAERLMIDPALAPVLGPRELGALIPARIVRPEGDGLTRLETSSGPIFLAGITGPAGSIVRVRIMAHDVILARERPSGLSAQNILPATVTAIAGGEEPSVIVHLAIGPDPVLARITRRALTELGLATGQTVHVVLKSMAVSRDDIAGEAYPAL
ncbi:MAG: molybdenum ABC transporter ATP-binding protein [Tabrizicola sp.]|nr:molybdenum ABC transporter ATP-binding protein [Tabrizicola sp.]